MALPTVEKTWEISLNNRMGGIHADTDHRYAMLHIYTTLLGFTNNPFTLHSSSDANTYGTPGPGWSVYTDLDWSQSGNRSWAVLNRPNSGGQLLMHCYANNTSIYYYRVANFVWSPGGLFTGGTLTSRPTATDERTMVVGDYRYPWYFGQDTTARHCAIHTRHSTDGKHTYMFFCTLGRTNQMLIMTTPEDYPSSWTVPHLAAMVPDAGTDEEHATYSEYYSNQRFLGRDNSGNAVSASMIVPSYDGSAWGSAVGNPQFYDASQEWPMTSIQLGSVDAECYGLLGRLPDIWGGSTNRRTGDCYPSSGTKTHCQFGDFVVPWDGSIPIVW